MDEYMMLHIKLGELEGAMEATKRRFCDIPKQMASELRSEERIEAARYLYWFTEISAQDIAKGLLGMDITVWRIDNFLERIGTTTIDVTCDRCQQPMECRSRQQMLEITRDVTRRRGPRYAEGYRVLCAPCWDVVQQERESSIISQ
jgi:hypothetical protein